ncbi:CopG family transcriptional regulator [Microbacterium sp.]|uniref:CopG family transcriptional regulator n=1 Tax=Microbacterium sp. TaxID=51671 RepID=UPI003C78592C
MKTAISVPDDTFARAERAAARHGLNRSQFYTMAAERFASELEASDITAAINAVVDGIDVGSDESTTFAVEAGRTLLSKDDDQW